MNLPGIEIRPIREMTGEATFNEVFFTDVRVPDTMRVGAEGDVAVAERARQPDADLRVGDRRRPGLLVHGRLEP